MFKIGDKVMVLEHGRARWKSGVIERANTRSKKFPYLIRGRNGPGWLNIKHHTIILDKTYNSAVMRAIRGEK